MTSGPQPLVLLIWTAAWFMAGFTWTTWLAALPVRSCGVRSLIDRWAAAHLDAAA